MVLAFSLLRLVTDLDRAREPATRTLQPGGPPISKTTCISEMNPLNPYLARPVMPTVGKAPHVPSFDADVLPSAMARQGMDRVPVERHGTRGKDLRVFIVARNLA